MKQKEFEEFDFTKVKKKNKSLDMMQWIIMLSLITGTFIFSYGVFDIVRNKHTIERHINQRTDDMGVVQNNPVLQHRYFLK